MNKYFIFIVMLSFSIIAFSSISIIYSPITGVVCDKMAGYCVNSEGVSIALTTQYLGYYKSRKLESSIGDGSNVNFGEYTLSNGVYCNSQERQCYKDRYFPRTKDKRENKLTAKIFGKLY